MYTYFTATKNSWGVPLTYVIRKTPASSGIVINREQEMIQNAPLQGNIFSFETKKVLEIIKELTVDTDSETYMKGKRCGRDAILASQNHCDGKS